MRKQTYQIRSNLTVTLNGVVLPKLPSASDINIGEIALNYKDGYETISIKNDNNEIVTFATLELLINYMEGYYGNAKIFKGTCATAAATTAKVVTCPLFKSTDLVKGTLIFVTFDLTNSGAVGSLTMNVNSTGAKSIKKLINNTAIASSNLSHAGELKANQTYLFEYDGTYWVCTTLDYNSTYSAMTQAEIDAGTSTTGKLITAKLLRDNFYTETECDTNFAKVPLVIEVNDTDTTVPSGTCTSIGAALDDDRDVIIRLIRTLADNDVVYLPFIWNDYDVNGEYDFSAAFGHVVFSAIIFSNDNLTLHEETIITGGTTSSVEIASGDRIFISDLSDERKAKPSVTFDGSTTTKALTPKGTWETFLKTAPVTSVNGQTGDVEVVVPQSLLLKGITPQGHTLADAADSYYANELNNGEAGAWFISYSNGDILVKSSDTSKDQDGRVCLSSSWKSRLNYGGMTWANVGDILLVYKQSSLIVVYKVMSINEAGETRIGLMSPNDKIQVNKISNIEGNVNNLLGKIDKRLPYSTDSTNIGNAGNGAYTNVTAGRTNWLDTSTAGAAIKLGNLQIAIDNSGRLYSRNQTNNIWNVTNQLKTITETDLNNVFEPSVIGYATVTNGPSETGNYTVYTFTSSDYDGNGFRSILQIAINRNSGNQYMRTCFKKVDGSGTDFTSTDWKLVSPSVTSVNGQTGEVTITETQLSKGTATGTGNAVTDINVSNHQITLVKGATYATQSDIDTSIANLVDSAPETLDTLSELAAALGDDPSFATTVANQIGQKYTKPSTGIPASDLAAGVIPAAPGTLNTNNTTAQTVSSSEALSGAIKLHKVSKTGSYSDLIKPSTGIPKTDLASAVQTSLGKADTSVQNKGSESNIVVGVGNNSNISVTSSTIGMETENSAIGIGNDITLNTSGVVNYNGSRVATVTDLQGKQDVIRDLQTIRDGAADGATAIQGVKVNGTALTPDANKAVDVTVPTNVSDLTNDLNFVRRYHLLGLSVLLLGDDNQWIENSELNTPTVVFKFNQTEDNILLGEFYPTFMYCKLPKAANSEFYPNTTLGLTSYITINLGEPLGYYNGSNAKPYWRTGWDVVPTVSLAFDNGSGGINTVPGINMTFVGVLDRGAIGQGTHYIAICYNSIYRNYNFELLIFYDLELQRLRSTNPFVLTISDLGEVNTIETIKVNNTALTPDANKAVNITAIPASIVTEDSTHKFATNAEKTKWNTLSNVIDVPEGPNLTVTSPTIMAVGESSPGYGIESNAIYIKAPTGSSNANILKITGNGIQTAVLNSGSLSAWTSYGTSNLTPTAPISIVQGTGSSLNIKYIKLVGNKNTDIAEIIESPDTNGGWEHAGNSGIPTVGLVASKVDAKYTKPSTGIPKTDLASAVQTSLGKADSAIQGVKVNGTSVTPDSNKIVDITIPEGELSTNYEPSSLDNEDLELAAGDTYEEAFGKLEKSINDNELITAAALTDLDSRINTLHLPQSLDDIPDGSTRKLSDYATTTLLATKQDALVSGTNIKTINNESILGSGNITIQGGSGGGDTNVIETVKVNGTALTPDSNKAVDISIDTIVIDLYDEFSGTLMDNDVTGTLPSGLGLSILGKVHQNKYVVIVGADDAGNVVLYRFAKENQNGRLDFVCDTLAVTWILRIDPADNSWVYKKRNKGTINGVQVNGTDLTPDSTTNKVDITVPAAVTESTVSGWGFTKNAGTITGITMNGASKGTSGVVDLGTVITSETALSKGTTTGNGNAVTDISVNGHQITLTKGTTFLTSHQGIKTLKTDNTTAQSTSSSETIAGSGTINLHKVAKTGTYSDLIGKPTIPTVNNATLTIQKNGTNVGTFTANASSNVTANIQVNELPIVSSSDNGKVLQVVNGAWSLVMPTSIYSGTSTPDSNIGNNGDIYLQTS